MTDAEMSALPAELLAQAQAAVAATVTDKIQHFLGSAQQADSAAWQQALSSARL
jgi:hypothetical protein